MTKVTLIARPDRHVSPLMANILIAVASRAEAGSSVRELVAAAERAGRKRSVARAGVSRVIRRLWLQGLVELHDSRSVGMGRTMSSRRQRARQIVAEVLANPEASYQGALALTTFVKRGDPWGSADACIAAKITEAARIPRLRVVRVVITYSGRAVLERRLTVPPAGQGPSIP